MRYIKSTTHKSYMLFGQKVPSCVNAGNKYLILDDGVYAEFSQHKLVQSMIKSGELLVLEQEPEEVKNSIPGLTADKARLVAQNTELQAQLEALRKNDNSGKVQAEYDEFKKQALQELQEAQDKINRLEAQIAKSKKRSE